MAHRIGDGLPTTLTASRIKAVLDLPENHEASLKEALDAGEFSGWIETTSEPDFYERLRALFATAMGRNAYEAARPHVAFVKSSLFGRSDFLGRLVEACRQEAPGQSETKAYRRIFDQDLVDRLVRDDAWPHLAEVIWAESMSLGDGDHLLRHIAEYPDIRPYLEQVQAGITRVDTGEDVPTSEDEGEVEALIARVGRTAESLAVSDINVREILTLSMDAVRLGEIAKARNTRGGDVSLQWVQVEQWEAEHADAIAATPKVGEIVAALKVRIERDTIDSELVGSVLGDAEKVLLIDARYRNTHEELKRASREEDFDSVHSHADALKSLRAKRDEAYVAIESVLSGHKPEQAQPDEPSQGDQSEPPDSESTGRGEHPDDPRTIDPEQVPTDVASNTAASQPEADQGSALADEGAPNEPLGEPIDDTQQPDDDNQVVQPVEDAIAAAFHHDRLAVAYHLARTELDALPSANTVKLVACNYVTDERTPVDAELSSIAAALLAEPAIAADAQHDSSRSRDHAVLATCAALAPALAAPGGPGGPVAQLLTLLADRLGDMPALGKLASTAAKVSMTGIHLPVTLLREDDSHDKWREKESALRNETKTWVTNERRSTIKFHAATIVWRRILEDWGTDGRSSLGRVFRLLDLPHNEIDADLVSEISEYWRTHREKEIDRIDREIRSRASTRKIEGSARVGLRNKVDQALALSDRWLALIREHPGKRLQFHTEQARALRNAVSDYTDQALAEIEEIQTPIPRAASALLRRYRALFDDTEAEINPRPIDLSKLLSGDLLADPGIALDDVGQPPESPLDLDVLRNLANQDVPDFGRAAVERAQRGDFVNAEAAIDFAERTGRIDDENADRSRNAIDELRARVQQRLDDEIKDTSDRLDAAYAEGTLALETYDHLCAQMPQIDSSETKSYARFFDTLEVITANIDNAKSSRRDLIRRRLDTLDRLSPKEQERIDSVLSRGHFQIAEDFLERVERGETLPATEAATDLPFDHFFPNFVEAYSAFGQDAPGRLIRLRGVLESRSSSEFVDASGLSEDAVREGIALLDAWIDLCDYPTSNCRLLPLMRALGFENPKVKRSSDKTGADKNIYVLDASPVANRDIARLPDFGSRADGNYRLFAVRGRTTGEAVIREAEKRRPTGSPPNIALFIGVLDVESRRMLAQAFGAGECHSTIVLDEALVAFLATWPGNRLAAFFDCTSAFAFSQPFDPDAPELPPEMFFGRKAARQAILATSGDMTHLVYGGRRLGKTTLLADIAREYRTRSQDGPEELVLLVNLKGSGIGESRPTEDLWHLFSERLIDHGILQPQTIRPESIDKGVRKWFEEIPSRRILLLVDEADAFLDAERRPKQRYRVLEQIKRLMEETQRRFKVVFAGLHNVQRAARDPNTPLAHLGEAIRIGPMLPEIDGDEIQNLIRSPLEALGYRFVSNDSVVRIAAETNYYPALAQQFCKELLKTLREEANAGGGSGPPFPIQPELVDRVFAARETRNRIRNLFSWTIELDPRYEFLTYLIAQRSFDNEDARPQTVPVAEIRETALKQWREGFSSDPSFWMFEVLLEEMVGLGILRESSDKQYAIRTRNLRMLLGNDEEIERRFTDARSRMAPPIFDPAQYRNTLEDGTPSSFAADQESRLLSGGKAVALVFGTRLAGIDRVYDSIQDVTERWDRPLFLESAMPSEVRSVFGRVLQSRKPGVHVILADMRGGWDLETVDYAFKCVGEHVGHNRIIRPVFLCGPQEAWQRLNGALPAQKGVECREVWLGPCARDFIRTWLTDLESRAYASFESPKPSVDLPWPCTAGMAGRNKHLGSIDDVIQATLDEDQGNQCVSDILISPNSNVALRLLADFPDESMSPDFLSEWASEEGATISPDDVMKILDWADRLGVVCMDEHGYRLDSTYAAGLGRNFGA